MPPSLDTILVNTLVHDIVAANTARNDEITAAVCLPPAFGRNQSKITSGLSSGDPVPSNATEPPVHARKVVIPTSDDGSSEGTVSMASSQMASTPSTTPKHAFSPALAELRAKVSKLYRALGCGDEVLVVAQESTLALQKTIELMAETMALVRSAPLLPVELVAEHAHKFQELLKETEALLKKSCPPSSSTKNEPSGPPPTATTPRPSLIANEMYDLSVLSVAFPGRPEDTNDDEVLHLKSRVQQLHSEVLKLQSSGDRSERQLKLAHDTILKECEDMKKRNERLEAELSKLRDHVSKLEEPHMTARYAAVKNPQRPLSRPAECERNPLAERGARPDMRCASAGGNNNSGSESTAATSPRLQALLARAVVVPPLETVYADAFEGFGMEMIWNAIECVFKREFDCKSSKQPNTSQQPPGPPTPTVSIGKDSRARVSVFTENEARAIAAAAVSEAVASSPFLAFQRAFDRSIGSYVRGTEDTFLSRCSSVTSLRSEYLANCLSHNVRANTGVLRVLTTIVSDRGVTRLSLAGLYLVDTAIAPFLPLLARLHRLEELDLSDNGLTNDAVKLLVQALQRHPSIRKIDLHNNPISRAGGKELLGLITLRQNVREVDVRGTQIEPLLQDKLMKKAILNNCFPQRATVGAEQT